MDCTERYAAERDALNIAELAELIGRMVPRSDRGLIYGMSSSAMFLGNSLGPLTGGFVAASFGLRWVFIVTAGLLLVNLVWVYFNVKEYREQV